MGDVPFDVDGNYQFWHEFFPLCPGSQLETLTILDGGPCIERPASTVSSSKYFDIELQVRAGCGWRQLRYLINNPEALTFERVRVGSQSFTRDPQPATWSSIVQQRDKHLTGAKVEIFVAKKEYVGQKGSILNPEKREVFDNNATEWNRTRQRLYRREMMVVIQRGTDAYVAEDGSGLKSLVLELFEDRSWQMIKEAARRLRAIRESELLRSDPNRNNQDALRAIEA